MNTWTLLLAAAATFSAGPVLAQQRMDPLLGRNLAATCAGCHGTNGQARGEMRPLAGVPADKIVTAVANFRSGAVPATVMHQIAKGYTDEQIRLAADYFAAQPAAK
jgi:cytochrome c553